MRYYEVAPTKIVRANTSVLTYTSPKALVAGSFVIIPVGKQSLLGLVVQEVQRPSYQTKPVETTLKIPTLPAELIKTALWIADYYHTPLATVLQTILPRGITKQRRTRTTTPRPVYRNRTNFLLNKYQNSALEAILATTSGTVLLHGVTGSGKTAIYIEYAKRLLAQGKSVIVLVPEIALTSQLVGEFQHFFSDIIVTHSKQTEAERHIAWTAAATATSPQVVIGPRSALFLPLRSIGAIIIDEAHEPSYKQEQAPRYSALRVASIISHYHNGITIQGSATPLVSEYFLAEQHQRPILHLPYSARTDVIKPRTTLVDMTKRNLFTSHRFFSDELLATIHRTLESNQQVLIFHNRRGSASTTLCEHCGWSATCPRCFIPLTLHADSHELRCHICNHSERVYLSCPQCQSTNIIHKGIGTKLIASELQRLFPKKKIMRFDGDIDAEDSVERQYQSLYDGTAQIIIGTQVIAKGLDLPQLGAVGVVQADAGLSLPDFTSSERTFQLLAQVVGRVGRTTSPTQVIIQSYQPTNVAVRYGIDQDYEAFYRETLPIRKSGSFPPYTFILKLTCVYKTEAAAIRNSKALADTIRKQYSDVTVLGPTPAFYERQHDTYRWQLTIKSPKRSQLIESRCGGR